jgi:hypothetical protein
MNPRDFHSLAAGLAFGPSAAHFRTAIGRSSPKRAAIRDAIERWRKQNGYL